MRTVALLLILCSVSPARISHRDIVLLNSGAMTAEQIKTRGAQVFRWIRRKIHKKP